MKKFTIVLAVLVLACSAIFAADAKVAAVGLEGGYPSAGITADFDINKDFDIYTTLGFGYSGALRLSVGAQYNVAQFKIEKQAFDVLVGAQVSPMFLFAAQSLDIAAYGTAAVSYDFTVKTDSNKLNFNAFIKCALGYEVIIGETFNGRFDYGVSAGLLYKF